MAQFGVQWTENKTAHNIKFDNKYVIIKSYKTSILFMKSVTKSIKNALDSTLIACLVSLRIPHTLNFIFSA